MKLPNRTISTENRITVRRLLPAPGEVLVQSGQKVEALAVVARTEKPSRYHVIDVARHLANPNVKLDEVLQVKAGQQVEAGQIIATRKGGLFSQRSVYAPVNGHISTIGPGWVLLESDPTTIELQAFISGRVTRVIPTWGAIIEAEGAVIEAACGFGGEAHGKLRRLSNSPFDELLAAEIDENVSEAIVIGGRTIDEETLRVAERWRVRGIIVGSIDASLLELDPPVDVRVVVTEGFGDMPMSTHTFGILTSMSRRQVSIRGQMPPSTGRSDFNPVDEGPIILSANTIPSRSNEYTGSPSAQKQIPDVSSGSLVRVTQGQLLGTTGKIDSIPSTLQLTEAGVLSPGAYVKFGEDVRFIPWANLEQVE